MSTYISKNRYLSEEEQQTNARYIWDYLGSRGWTLNAVAAMLGNMETESTINPGIWESLTVDTSRGYGLVQWTPSTKYTDWCSSEGLDPSALDSALKRIEYELANGLQWIRTDAYDLSFQQFKTSTATIEWLAMAFLHNYERPASLDQPWRATQAVKWYNYLSGTNPTPVKPKTKGMSLLLMWAATRHNVVR